MRHSPLSALVAGLTFLGLGAGWPIDSQASSLVASALTEFVPAETTILVGVIVNGREVGSIEIIRRADEFLLPLEEVAPLIGASVEESDGRIVVTTPIGRVSVDGDELVEVDSVLMVPLQFFEQRLATEVGFDQQEFALSFQVPWGPGAVRPVAPTVDLGEPDFFPPTATVATLQTDLSATRQFGSSVYTTSTIAEGRLASGWWRVRYDDDLASRHRFEEYSWLQSRGRRQLLLGYQRIRLHPLFDSMDLTGAQVAITNVDLDFFSRSRQARELLSRRMQSLTKVRGMGPPGGQAELRIDGIPFDRRVIALNGTYEFVDVLLPSRQATRIEVYIFDRSNLSIPIAIHEETRSAFDLLMDGGAWVQQGGLGRQGNLVEDNGLSDTDSGLGGFYQVRYGLSDRLTVEATAQRVADRYQIEGGLVARLGDGLVAAFSGASSDGALGYDFELSGQWSQFWIQARSTLTQEGFHVFTDDKEYNHYLEFGVDPHRTLGLSIVARRRQSLSGDADYVLPTLSWRPSRALSIRVYPDIEGRYLGNIWYRIDDRTRFALSVLEDISATAELSRQLNGRTALLLGADVRAGLPDRFSAILKSEVDFATRTTIGGGPLFSDGDLGYEAWTTIGIDPGLVINLELQDDPSLRGLGERAGRRYFIGLSVDLGFAGGRMIPAHRGAVRDDRGAIAGTIRAGPGVRALPLRLDGILVLVDGGRGGRTDSNGRFFVGRLGEGLYSVELDVENLPIDLVPDRSRWTVKVAAGAVTRIDFAVHPEYGIAGRLTDAAGRVLAGLRLDVVDEEGERIASAVTDRFGLYRVDGLTIGRYTVRVAEGSLPDQAEGSPSLEVEIVDDFLFGQDLILPFEVPGAPGG
ncbi:MAG: carboxypeptidase regulatory-like domain-containing protein [Thermoanaerobaculales bacterium]